MPTVDWKDCWKHQFLFASPASFYQSFVPKGFALRTLDPDHRFVEVFGDGSQCRTGAVIQPNGERVDLEFFGDYVLLAPVYPSAALRDSAFQNDWVVVALYNTHEPVRQAYRDWGLSPIESSTTYRLNVTYNQPVTLGSVLVEARNETYQHVFEILPTVGSVGKGVERLWVQKDGEAVGWLRHEWGAGTLIGHGSAELRHAGPARGVTEPAAYGAIRAGDRVNGSHSFAAVPS